MKAVDGIEQNFKQDVSASLKRLLLVLQKRAANVDLTPENREVINGYLGCLQLVANNAAAYCNPAYFSENMRKLGFWVNSGFTLYNVDFYAAECVHGIMVCRRDYIYHSNKEKYAECAQNEPKQVAIQKKLGEFKSEKYYSKDAAIDAMCRLKRDSIMIEINAIPDFAWYRLRNLFRCSK